MWSVFETVDNMGVSLHNPDRDELTHTSFPAPMRPRVNGPLISLTTFLGICSFQTQDPQIVSHSTTEEELRGLCSFLITHSSTFFKCSKSSPQTPASKSKLSLRGGSAGKNTCCLRLADLDTHAFKSHDVAHICNPSTPTARWEADTRAQGSAILEYKTWQKKEGLRLNKVEEENRLSKVVLWSLCTYAHAHYTPPHTHNFKSLF